MAAAISRIRSLPFGWLRTRKMRTTAKATAASPPATPNQAVLGSIDLPRIAETDKRRPGVRRAHFQRSDRLNERENHHLLLHGKYPAVGRGWGCQPARSKPFRLPVA